MKLLFVLPEFPHPPRKGYLLLALEHLKFLAARHELHVLCFTPDGRIPADDGGLGKACRSLAAVKHPRGKAWLQTLLAACSAEPYQVHYYRSGAMAEAVRSRLAEKPDVAVFQLTRMAQYRPADYAGRTVLDLVDPYVLNYERSLAWRPGYLRGFVRAESARLRAYEAARIDAFDRLLLVAEADVRDYRALYGRGRFEQVPHGVDPERFAPGPDSERVADRIVMTGNLGYPPNVQGADWFCREVFPRIRAAIPGAHLQLVGARPARSVRAWASVPGIEVTGPVPDLAPYLRRARVAIAPVTLRAGTQTKVLEAMASGTPVVATSAANHGLGAEPGRQLRVADEPEAFAAAVAGLLKGEGWGELSAGARAWVTERHAWARGGERLERILESLAAPKG